MSPEQPTQVGDLTVAAVVRHGAEIALVRRRQPDKPEPIWALPSCVVGHGELLTEALRRMVQNETGLRVREIKQLACMIQLHTSTGSNRSPGGPATVVVFDIARWDGEISVSHLGAVVQNIRFFPEDEALRMLEGLPSQCTREPIVAYLRGEVEAGALWVYQRGSGGSDDLRERVPPASVSSAAHLEPRDNPFEISMLTLGCMGIIFLVAIVIVVGLVAVSH